MREDKERCTMCHGSGKRYGDYASNESCDYCNGYGYKVIQYNDSSSSSSSRTSAWKANDGTEWNTEKEAMLRNTILNGNNSFDRGDYIEAIGDFTAAIDAKVKTSSTQQDNIYCYAKRGESYLELGSYDLAIADFTTAIDNSEGVGIDNEKLAARYLNRGKAYSDKGDIDKSFSDNNKVVSLGGKYLSAAFHNRGMDYIKLGKVELAIASYKIAAGYGEEASLKELKSRNIDYTPLKFDSDNSRHFSAAELLNAAGEKDISNLVLDHVSIIIEHTDKKQTAISRGYWLKKIAALYFKNGAADAGIQNMKYSANYNNKEAKQYLKDNKIKHKRLIWEPYRNGFVSFLLALVCGAGAVLGVIWILTLKYGSASGGFLLFLGLLASLIIPATIAGSSWRHKNNLVFVLMFLLSVPGWLSMFGLVPGSFREAFELKNEKAKYTNYTMKLLK